MAINVYLLRVIAAASAWVAGFNWYRFRQGRPLPYLCSVLAILIAAYDRNLYGIAASVLAYLHGSRIRVVGLTGGIATGKSSVSRRLAQLGATVIDADQVARDVVEPGKPTLVKLVHHFGSRILDDKGCLNRAELRAIIANDAEARKFVNKTTHPAIAMEILRRIAWHRWLLGEKVILDAALLFESGFLLPLICSPILVVTCHPRSQLDRLVQRDGGERDHAQKLISAQKPQEEKAKKGDIVIPNDGSVAELNAAVDAFWRAFYGATPVHSDHSE